MLPLLHLVFCIPSALGYNLVKNSRGWIRGQNQAIRSPTPPARQQLPFQALPHTEVGQGINRVVWDMSSWRTLNRRWAGDEDLVERSGQDSQHQVGLDAGPGRLDHSPDFR